MTDPQRVVHCRNGHVIPDGFEAAHGEKPCPECGSTFRVVPVTASSAIALVSGVTAVAGVASATLTANDATVSITDEVGMTDSVSVTQERTLTLPITEGRRVFVVVCDPTDGDWWRLGVAEGAVPHEEDTLGFANSRSDIANEVADDIMDRLKSSEWP